LPTQNIVYVFVYLFHVIFTINSDYCIAFRDGQNLAGQELILFRLAQNIFGPLL